MKEALKRLDALFQDRSIKREVELTKIRHNMTPDALRRSVESPQPRTPSRTYTISTDALDRHRAAEEDQAKKQEQKRGISRGRGM